MSRPLSARIPEPALMDDHVQARAYSEADFGVPHQAFVDTVVERFGDLVDLPTVLGRPGRLLDLGCGPADVTVRLARALPGWRVDGVDGAAAMLAFGRTRVAVAGLDDRVHLHHRLLPDPYLPVATYDLVVATSVLHHLDHPSVLWHAAARSARPGAVIAVHDLRRPATTGEAAALVERHAADEPDVLRHDFLHSLYAAYTIDEVREQLRAAELDHATVEPVGDRHLLVTGRR